MNTIFILLAISAVAYLAIRSLINRNKKKKEDEYMRIQIEESARRRRESDFSRSVYSGFQSRNQTPPPERKRTPGRNRSTQNYTSDTSSDYTSGLIMGSLLSSDSDSHTSHNHSTPETGGGGDFGGGGSSDSWGGSDSSSSSDSGSSDSGSYSSSD